MKVVVFSSGSAGNCTLIRTNDSNILIDAGLTKKAIETNLNENGLSLSDINALFITHEHGDHISGLPVLLKECNMKIYMTRGTFNAIYAGYVAKKKDRVCQLMDARLNQGDIIYINRIENSMLYNSFSINNTKIDIVPTFHDAAESVGFVINDELKRLVYITDTGYVHQGLYQFLNDADAYILESNHDPEILMHSGRPYHLKIRILSDHGHMSNEDSMITLVNLIGPSTKLVMHAHISQECNLTQIVEMTRRKVFDEYGLSTDGIEFVMLYPRPSKEYSV